MSRFERHIFICENERPASSPRGSCLASGSGLLKNAFTLAIRLHNLDAELRINTAGCLDACEFGPAVIIYPEGVWYGGVQESDVDEIVVSHLINGKPVERLLIMDPRYGQTGLTSPSQQER